jgi:hypothetical protein
MTETIKKGAVFFSALTLLITITAYASATSAESQGITVSAPTVVIQTAQIPCLRGASSCGNNVRRFDAQVSNFAKGSTMYWFATNSYYMTKFQGTLGSPFATKVWTKSTRSLFGEPPIPATQTRDRKWITSIYQTDAGGILGFVHIEREPDDVAGHKGRVGLAWSTDFGESFTYLGHIAIPDGDPEIYNVSGVPYFIKDGYFYAYYIDRCPPGRPSIAVIRAPVAEVIAAARKGKITPWKKYYNGGWTEPGIGGKCTQLMPTDEGTINSDAVYSSYTNKAYMLLSDTAANNDKLLKLYESTDGISWTFAKTIVRSPASAVKQGYLYSWIVPSGAVSPENNITGRFFHVYAARDAAASSETLENGVVLRWLVDLGSLPPPPPIDVCPLVVGNQSTGPCADTQCIPPATWATSTQSCGIPTTLPPPQTDICPLVNGDQTVGPCADTLCVAPQTWDTSTQECIAPVVIAPPPPSPSQFPQGFSATQGKGGWHYQYKTGDTYVNMTWDASTHNWRGNETALLIGNGFLHPGVTSVAVLTWIAPQTGTVNISGSAKDKDKDCGDGVSVFILQGTTVLWQAAIANGNSTGKSYSLPGIPVTAGGGIRFIVNNGPGNNNGCDSTELNPTITYTPVVQI